MKAIIIEDEKRAAARLIKLISDLAIDIEIIASLSSVNESMEWFRSNPIPDLIISDIELGDGKVFELLEKLDKLPPIIFTTAYDEFAIRAFKNNGIDYLLKPVDPVELNVALQKFKDLRKQQSEIDLVELASILNKNNQNFKSRFIVKIGEKIKSIPIEDISCFYSFEGGAYIRTMENRNYSIDYSMDQLEELVNPFIFFRVNRKLILNYSSIDTLHTWSGSRLKIELSFSIKELEGDIVVSRERVKEFKQWLDR
jgi:DNA-binding LytR/AlgR family response regulator